MPTLLLLAALFLSIIIHEVSHGAAADALGDPTARHLGRLTLNPLAHIDPIGSILVPMLTLFAGGFVFGWAKPVPYNPLNLRNPKRDSVLVALAGPASNILIAIILALIVKFGIVTLAPTAAVFLLSVIRLNLGLAIFNLMPIPPLDGSKLLLTFLPYEAQIFLEQYGLIFVFIFLFTLSHVAVSIVDALMGLLIGG